ncbi:unnamed protein product [Microthlaspi erraticum]|uniref:Uncharacterized protein n=1 Tax=Microthlaspi erraticum TaxID=1685480 RepID=A0A6D2I1J4_9BRAS|nr:unnamed protein product [Microthlaspi erraticum]
MGRTAKIYPTTTTRNVNVPDGAAKEDRDVDELQKDLILSGRDTQLLMKDKNCPNQSDRDIEKRSYNQKSEDCPDGSIENQRPTAQSGWPRNDCSALGQIISVRLKSRPKFQTVRPITHHDPGNIVPRSATNAHAKPRTTKRASRETSLAAAQPFAYHGRCIRPTGKDVPRPAENSSAKLIRSDHAGRP